MASPERFPPWRLPLLLVAGAAALIAGCGGGGGKTVSTSSLTQARFVKQADAICVEGRLRGLRYRPSPVAAQTSAALAEAIEANVFPAIQETIERLYALGAPMGERGRVEAFLSSFQKGLEEGEDLEVPSFERLDRVLAQAGEMAQKNGLEACVYG